MNWELIITLFFIALLLFTPAALIWYINIWGIWQEVMLKRQMPRKH